MGHNNLIKNHTLGTRLKDLRCERNLSQRELASLAGLSPNSISLIERNEISPTVATLQSLATALGVKIGYFFDDKIQKRVIHSKAGQRRYIRSKGTKIEGIGERINLQEIEPFLVTMEPHSRSGDRQAIHTGQEVIYCLRGKVEYRIDGEIYLLEAGDFLLFEAHLPHIWFNHTEEVAQLLLVLETHAEPSGPIENHFLDLPSVSHLG